MKILITGAKGQLGYDVLNQVIKRGYEAIGTDIDDMDITNQDEVEKKLMFEMPDIVIHCAAWTAVDLAEDFPEKVNLINVTGTENIAKTCKKINCKMIYISTDYVFEGNGTEPWKAEDKCNPQNVYGKAKYDGELAAEKYLDKLFIIRISWVFGKNGNNFVKTMLNIAKTRNELSVVNDQIGTPTYTFDLARLLIDISESEKYGKYNATNSGGYISWFEFASEIFKCAAVDIKLNPITSDEFPVKAKRPFNSRLDKSKLIENGFKMLPDWKDALNRFLKETEC